NPNLNPEQAETLTFGVVLQPTFAAWLEGLQLSVDWYEVKIHGAVDTLGIQRIVDECELNGVQELCQQILRNPQTGEIGRILDTFLNVAQAKVEGIDTEIVYNIEPDFLDASFETFSLRALAGYIMERSDTPFGGEPFDVAGSRGTPALTGVLSATY